MAAYQTQQINVGSIAAPDVGSVFANFADRLQKQQSNQIDMARQMRQDDRQQVLNQRADQEWNRQQGIIQAKKDVASDFAKNPYAEIYGGKQENAGLDKQVLDYVNNGGEINEDLAKRLQGLYEQHKPFREDAKAAVTQQLIAKGLDASEAEKEAAGIVGNLPSRVELQARADAQRKAQQEYYDNVAKANVEAMKINTDIWGKQANISNDQYLAMVKNGMGTGGSGAGGGMYGKTYGDVQNEVGKLDISPSWAPQWASLDENVLQGKIAALRDAGVPPALVSKAIQNSVDVSAGGKNIDQDLLAKNLANLQVSYGKGGNIPQAPVVSAKDLMPAIAGYSVVDYNPNTLIDRARQVAPELFRGDPNKIVEETKVSNPDVAKSIDMFTQQTKKVESSNNYSSVNKESGAMGAYQFLPSTLNDYRGKHGLPNFTNEEFLNNKDLQDKVFNEFTKDNAHKLEVLGIEPTPLNLYAAHNLGIGNVKELNSNSENMSNRLQKALAANHLDSKEDWFNRNSSKFEIKPITSKYSGLKLPEATKQAYKDIIELYTKNTPEVYQGQIALNASRGDMSEEAYKKYLDWAAKEDPGIRPILEGYTGTTTEDNAKTFLRQQDIASKYINNPNKLTAAESRWIKESRQTPNGRKLLASLGIE